MQMIQYWWMAFRPKTLTAAIVPIAVGTGLAFAETDQFDIRVSIFALLSAVFIQIGTNLFNDAMDFKKGADTSERLGPERVTQSEVFTFHKVVVAATISFIAALICGLPLVALGGWPIITIGLVSILMGYAYTGGPFPLAYKGLGDLFVVIFFGIVAVSGVYYLQTLTWSLSSLVAGTQVGFLATVLIAINNLRDVEQDKKVGKKTLAVRFGRIFSLIEIGLLSFGSFALGIYWYWGERWLVFALPLILLPLAVKILVSLIETPPGVEYNGFLAKAAGLHLLFGILFTLAVIF